MITYEGRKGASLKLFAAFFGSFIIMKRKTRDEISGKKKQ